MAKDDARSVGKQFVAFSGDATGKLQLRLYQVLTSGSPVDTGFFRSKWIAGKRVSPAPKSIEAPDDKEAARAIAEIDLPANGIKAEIVSASFKLSDRRGFISNPTVYGPRLADGHSAQATSGWIPRAIAVAIRSVQRSPNV